MSVKMEREGHIDCIGREREIERKRERERGDGFSHFPLPSTLSLSSFPLSVFSLSISHPIVKPPLLHPIVDREKPSEHVGSLDLSAERGNAKSRG
jgi:hypothetical protein